MQNELRSNRPDYNCNKKQVCDSKVSFANVAFNIPDFRLMRRQLPVATDDFFVTYAPINHQSGQDIDWVCSGTGMTSQNMEHERAAAIYRRQFLSAEPIFYNTR